MNGSLAKQRISLISAINVRKLTWLTTTEFVKIVLKRERNKLVLIANVIVWANRVVLDAQENVLVGLKMTPKECVKRLKRRLDHLKKRIEDNPKKDLSFDVAEANAIEYAISLINPIISSETKREQAVASNCNGVSCECCVVCPHDHRLC